MSAQTVETRYFGYRQAATYLNISVGTLRRLVESGSVRAYPLGERLVRFDRLDLDKLMVGDEPAVGDVSG
jgi:excisionase family DNA binding protein